jgi:hypothetical protein
MRLVRERSSDCNSAKADIEWYRISSVNAFDHKFKLTVKPVLWPICAQFMLRELQSCLRTFNLQEESEERALSYLLEFQFRNPKIG